MSDVSKPAGRDMTVKELAAMDKAMNATQAKVDKADKLKGTLKLEVEQLKQEIQLAEMKHRSEIDGLRNSEQRLKAKVEGLEQNNQSLIEMLDKSATAGQLFAGKQKDFELFKEVTARELKSLNDQQVFMNDYFASETVANQKKQLAELRDKQARLQRDCEALQAAEKELLAKEEDDSKHFRSRRESQSSDAGVESEISKLKQTLADLADSVKAKHREKVDLESGMQKEAVMQAFLRAESDELGIRARQHEIELEEESRSSREELAKLRRESYNKEQRYKEIEKSNSELRAKKARLDEDLELITKKLDNLARLSTADGKKEKSGEDMKIVESLQIEKKELRGDLEKLNRTKLKLEASAKSMNQRLMVNQENTLLLANLIYSRETIDFNGLQSKLTHEEIDRIKNAVEFKSPFDQRQLIEKLSTENAELTKKMRLLEARSLMNQKKP